MGQADTGRELVAKPFDKTRDYDMLCKWWEGHGSYAPQVQQLPSTGIIVESDKPLCAGFLYNTDSTICVMEFYVCDPLLEKEERDKGLEYLIHLLKGIAINRGYEVIYTSTGIQKFIGRLKEKGFEEADKNQTHMFYFNYETQK